MRSTLLAASALTLFAGLATAQETDVPSDKPALRDVEVKPQENERANQFFYKAFYLQNGAKKFAQAIQLYKKFLEEAPHSQFAPIAARNTLNLLYRTNQIEQANEFRENHKGLLAKAVRRSDRPGQGQPGRRGNRQGGRVRGGRGNPRNAGAQLERLEKRLMELKQKIEEARKKDDMATVEKREGRLANLQRALKRIQEGGRQGNNRGQGRRGRGRRMMKPLTEMTKDELKQHIERMGSMIDRFSERLVEEGMEERAKKMKDAFQKFKALVEAGKIQEAQEFQRKIFRRRRRD